MPPIDEKSYFKLKADYLRLKSLCSDTSTEMNSYLYHMEEIRAVFEKESLLGVIYVNISNFHKLENIYGWQVSDEILRKFASILKSIPQEITNSKRIIAQTNIHTEEFLIFFPCSAHQHVGNLDLIERAVSKLEHYITTEMKLKMLGVLFEEIELSFGYSIICDNPFLRFERLIYNSTEEAKEMAQHKEERERLKRKMELRQIIKEEKISTFFQPIVNLQTSEILGYEALCRGPEKTAFEAADFLFTTSIEHNLSFELDLLCRSRILDHLSEIPKNLKLFINILPVSIIERNIKESKIAEIVEKAKIEPSNIVLEISEKGVIKDYKKFRRRMKSYRDMGFQVAIDDIGTGYSNIQTISEIVPDYLKIDIALIKNIHLDLIKQELLETLIAMAKKLNAKVISEGIENKEDLAILRDMGIEYGQGFYLSYPAPSFPAISKSSKKELLKRKRQ